MLTRFYSPRKGCIEIDGYDISKLNLYSLRDQIGIVPQDCLLFDGTIQENISLSNPDAPLEKVIKAAKIGVQMNLQKIYLSYIQMRKVLYFQEVKEESHCKNDFTDPKIVILDEATSALDFDIEKRLITNLVDTAKGKLFCSLRIELTLLLKLIIFY